MNSKTLTILTSVSLLICQSTVFADVPTPQAVSQPATNYVLERELSKDLDKLSKVELKGEVSVSDTHDKLTKTIDELTAAAVKNDPEMARLNAGATRYTKKREKVAATVAAAMNYGILTRGDMPSSEAGDVILNEKVKLKSKGSALYARQRQMDQVNLKVVSTVMDISMGLGTRDSARADAILSTGKANLTKLVGAEEADRAIADLRQIAAELQIPDSVYDQDTWTISDNQKRAESVLQAAVNGDPTIAEIKNIVHKYNHHSKLYRVSSRVMNVSLSIAGLTPTLVGPAAQIALLMYIMATGGPEEDKLMAELYLDKRLKSRFDLLKDKTQLAVDHYEIALLTKNPMLLVCSQSVVKQMTTDDMANHAFSRTFTASDTATATEKKDVSERPKNVKSDASDATQNVLAKKKQWWHPHRQI